MPLELRNFPPPSAFRDLNARLEARFRPTASRVLVPYVPSSKVMRSSDLVAHLLRRVRGTSRMRRTTRRVARSGASRASPSDEPDDIAAVLPLRRTA